MGCGFCCVVPAEAANEAVELLSARHRGAAVIGSVTDRAGVVELPTIGLVGREGAGFSSAAP
jgi:phosphoribosylformylglycinamidine cyclo-ligase